MLINPFLAIITNACKYYQEATRDPWWRKVINKDIQDIKGNQTSMIKGLLLGNK